MPWLIAEVDGAVAGFACADRFRDRSAYCLTLENSVYVDTDNIGKASLLADLIARCEALGDQQMIAVIGDSGNTASMGLHGALGFRRVGVYEKVGLKFGRWLDVVLMQRGLGEDDRSVPL